MDKQQAAYWVEDELHTLSDQNYVRIYYVCGKMVYKDGRTKYVIAPVRRYKVGKDYTETIALSLFSINCPWDMECTEIEVTSVYRHIKGNLLDLFLESFEVDGGYL